MTITYPAPIALSPGTTSQANAASADGSIIVGTDGTNAVVWTNGVETTLPTLAGSVQSTANGCSADGSVIVGFCYDASFNENACYWKAGTVTQLIGPTDGNGTGVAYSCSDDGSIIVGFADFETETGAGCYWLNGSVVLPPPVPGQSSGSSTVGTIFACSQDGSIIAGSAGIDPPDGFEVATVATTWTSDANPTVLAQPPGAFLLSYQAQAITPDGSTVVGFSDYGGDAGPPFQVGEMWVNGNLTDLPLLSGGVAASALGVSGDGSVVSGFSLDDTFASNAVTWQGGNIAILPPLAGTSANGGNALAVSRDGSTVVGYAVDADGNQTAVMWQAELPPPDMFNFAMSDLTCTQVLAAPASGSDRNLSLRYSDDGGANWSNPIIQTMGQVGEYLTNIQFRRLGMARNRVIELSWASSAPTALTSVFISFEIAAT